MEHLKKFNESKTNDNKEMFIDALDGLFHYWGSDAPAEVYWGCNDLLDWYEVEFGVKLNIRFEEKFENGLDNNYNEVIEAIRNS